MLALVRPVVHVEASDLAATILGAVGVLLALVALAWQAHTFFRSGSRISVKIHAGATDGAQIATALTGELTGKQIESLVARGLPQRIVGVEVINLGRGFTSVHSVDLVFEDGGVVTGAYVRGSPDLPFRMEGESEKTWYFQAEHAERYATGVEQVKTPGQPYFVRGQARIGGKEEPVVSKNRVRVL